MTRKLMATGLLAAALGASACSQPDGPMPVPDEATVNEIGDVGRDIRAVAGKDLQAPKDLVEDLTRFSPNDEGEPATGELGRRLADVLPGRALKEPDADTLARKVWEGTTGRELSGKQVETLQDDIRSILMSTGVPQSDADSVAAQLAEVQKVVTQRQKRWYEFF